MRFIAIIKIKNGNKNFVKLCDSLDEAQGYIKSRAEPEIYKIIQWEMP